MRVIRSALLSPHKKSWNALGWLKIPRWILFLSNFSHKLRMQEFWNVTENPDQWFSPLKHKLYEVIIQPYVSINPALGFLYNSFVGCVRKPSPCLKLGCRLIEECISQRWSFCLCPHPNHNQNNVQNISTVLHQGVNLMS